MTRAAEAASEPGSAGKVWRGRAFGLDIESDFAVEGRCAPALPSRERPVRLRMARAHALLEAWPEGGSRISQRAFDDGSVASSIDWHPDAGFLTQAAGYGTYRLAADGGVVDCAPLEEPRWQRFLIGQTLPFASLLKGLEVFHAGAAAVNGGVVMFSGPSKAGKSSATIGLALRGHGFVADDVVAVEAGEAGLLVHPGVGAASLRFSTADELAGELERGAVEVLGRDEEALRVAFQPEPQPLPLRAVYLFDPALPFGIERLSPVSPQLLLGATFNFVIRTPARLTNQLDVCAAIASEIPVYMIGVAGPPPVRRLLDEVYSHVMRGSQ